VASKKYETQFLLGAKVHGSMGMAFGAVSKRMSMMRRQANMTQKTFGCLTGTIRRMYGGVAAYIGAGALLNYIKQSSEAAQAQIDAETKLNVIMKQRMKATDGQVKSILNLTAAQQKLGVIGDEVQLAGAQQLGTFLTQSKSLKVLVPAMNNLLAQQKGLKASQQDAVNIGNMMGKVFTGQVGALKRVGISFTASQEKVLKYGSEQQKAAMLAQVITDNVGKMNAALAKLPQGQIKQANNLLSDMQEQIGMKIIPIQVKLAQNFIKIIPYIEKTLPLLDKIPPVIDKSVIVAKNLYRVTRNTIDWAIKNWPRIEPFIVTLTAAYVANKVTLLGLIAVQKSGLIINALVAGWNTASAALALLREGNSLAAVAQLVFNGTLLACPITWIVAGITALVVAGYYLIKNWDKVKTFFVGLWNGPLNNKYVQMALTAFVPFIGLPITIIKNWEKIKTFFLDFWAWLKKSWKDILLAVFLPFIGLPMLFIKNWSKIKGLFGGGRKGKTVKIPPKYAGGTAYHPGGMAMVGEQGRELVNLPRGSRVISNNQTEGFLNSLLNARKAFANSLSYHPAVKAIINNHDGQSIPERFFNAFQSRNQTEPSNRIESLLKGLSGMGASAASSISVQYSPQFIIQGNADAAVIKDASDSSFADFERNFNALINRRRRLNFV
jgi:hypothetical protein